MDSRHSPTLALGCAAAIASVLAAVAWGIASWWGVAWWKVAVVVVVSIGIGYGAVWAYYGVFQRDRLRRSLATTHDPDRDALIRRLLRVRLNTIYDATGNEEANPKRADDLSHFEILSTPEATIVCTAQLWAICQQRGMDENLIPEAVCSAFHYDRLGSTLDDIVYERLRLEQQSAFMRLPYILYCIHEARAHYGVDRTDSGSEQT